MHGATSMKLSWYYCQSAIILFEISSHPAVFVYRGLVAEKTDDQLFFVDKAQVKDEPMDDGCMLFSSVLSTRTFLSLQP